MIPQGVLGVTHATIVRMAAIAAVLLILFRTQLAYADAVDSLIDQLEDSSDKVRLSAALNLTKLGDAKAILPLAKALGNDSDKNVRSAAAVGLGKLITASTKANITSGSGSLAVSPSALPIPARSVCPDTP